MLHQNEVSMATDTPRITEQGLAPALRGAGTNRTSADAGSSGHCDRAALALHEALIEARHNPETASYGRRDPESLDRLRLTVAKGEFRKNFCHITCQIYPLHAVDTMTG